MAAVNKNFVIKNGLEVDTNLIVADSQTNKVGIGTTVPQYTLHVNGGIGVTNAYVSGIGTFPNELNVGIGGTVLTVLGIGGSVGVGTAFVVANAVFVFVIGVVVVVFVVGVVSVVAIDGSVVVVVVAPGEYSNDG